MTSKELPPRGDGSGGGGSSGGKKRKGKHKSKDRDGGKPDRGAAGDANGDDGGGRSRGRRRRDGALHPLYDTLTRLEDADARAASPSRGGRGHSGGGGDDVARSRAARSQYGMANRLIEIRILMQRALQHSASALHGLETNDAKGDSTGRKKKRRRGSGGDDDLDDGDEGRSSDSDVDAGGSDDDGDAMNETDVVDNCRRTDALLRRVRTSLLSARDSALPALLASARLKNEDGTVAVSDDDDDDVDKIEERMRTNHERCREAWRAILDRRHRDVQLRSGLATMGSSSRDKFTVVNQGFWDQVESTLAHERLHRLDGGEQDDDADGGGNASSAPRPVYDDARSYQHMLRDFIERGSRGGAGDGDGGTAAEQQLRALRDSNRKRKADVDRRASKGRKIRYGAGLHPKLEGFTFPVPRGSATGIGGSGGPMQSMMIDEDDWFKSLFGGAASRRGENEGKVAEFM